MWSARARATHGPRGHGHDLAPAWSETVIDADRSLRGLDAVDRRTAGVTGGSATEGGPGLVLRTTDGGALGGLGCPVVADGDTKAG